MDIIMILGVMWLIGWFVIPMLYGIFIKAPKQYMDGDLTKPKQEDSDKSDFPYNRTLMFGEGLFSTFRYKSKLPDNFISHLERLKDSARMLNIKHPGDIYIESVLERAIKNSPFESDDLTIKLLVLIEGDPSYGALPEKSKLLISIKEFSGINKAISLTLSKKPFICWSN